MNREGCGETKGCLFKPAGCDPMRDCTIAVIFYVSGPNFLTIQVAALTLLPPPTLQYIAIGFSHDSIMGDDMVTECVLSPTGDEFASEPEVFVSYNIGKSNDRTYLNQTELSSLIKEIKGESINGRISCQWSQQIVPQQSSKGGRLWNLNHKYFILGATGSAQPDEINAHDTSMGSHFYPIVSARPINPSLIGAQLYDLPKPFSMPITKIQTTTIKHFIDPFSETKAILISIITFKNKPRNQKKRKNTTKKINIIRIGFLNLRQKKASGC
uniref:Secreted protein n=1 Tax=Panagrolaimus sp. JU765 TaxID=591449 RepID=A0AC34RIT2_9BILA